MQPNNDWVTTKILILARRGLLQVHYPLVRIRISLNNVSHFYSAIIVACSLAYYCLFTAIARSANQSHWGISNHSYIYKHVTLNCVITTRQFHFQFISRQSNAWFLSRWFIYLNLKKLITITVHKCWSWLNHAFCYVLLSQNFVEGSSNTPDLLISSAEARRIKNANAFKVVLKQHLLPALV